MWEHVPIPCSDGAFGNPAVDRVCVLKLVGAADVSDRSFFANPDSPQAKLLLIFLSVLMGYGLTKFFLDYLTWSMYLRHLF